MAKTYKDVMNQIKDIEPRSGLETDVFDLIDRYIEKQNFYRKLIGFSLSLLSALTFVPFAIYTSSQLYSSGIYNYLSLIFTDGNVVISNFREFILSVADSLPFFALTMTAFSIFMILVSVKYALSIKREFPYIRERVLHN